MKATSYSKIREELKSPIVIESHSKESNPLMMDILYDRDACRYFGISYRKPDMERARYVAHRLYQLGVR